MKTYELLREGEWTRDGRMLTAGTTTWRPQIPVMMLPVMGDGHEGGHIVGAIHHIRRKGNLIIGDTDVEIGDDLVLTCDVDSVGDTTGHDEGIEVRGGRLVAAYINTKDNYPWL